jgi:hypothetical protein
VFILLLLSSSLLLVAADVAVVVVVILLLVVVVVVVLLVFSAGTVAVESFLFRACSNFSRSEESNANLWHKSTAGDRGRGCTRCELINLIRIHILLVRSPAATNAPIFICGLGDRRGGSSGSREDSAGGIGPVCPRRVRGGHR